MSGVARFPPLFSSLFLPCLLPPPFFSAFSLPSLLALGGRPLSSFPALPCLSFLLRRRALGANVLALSPVPFAGWY
eukprot:8692661-Heterocapsa_arctica.AAC.1